MVFIRNIQIDVKIKTPPIISCIVIISEKNSNVQTGARIISNSAMRLTYGPSRYFVLKSNRSIPNPVVKNPMIQIRAISFNWIKIDKSKTNKHNNAEQNAKTPAKKPPKAMLFEPMALEVTTDAAKKNAPKNAIEFPKSWLSFTEFSKIINKPTTNETRITNKDFGKFSFKNILLNIAETTGDMDKINRLDATLEFKIENT